MSKISLLKSPALAGVVKEQTEKDAVSAIKDCISHGADMIDLHLSCLSDLSEESLSRIIASSTVPVLSLNYNQKIDMSDAGFSEEEREELFIRAVKAGADGVDIQGYTFDPPSKERFCGEDKYSFTKGNPREIVTDEKVIDRQRRFIDKVHCLGAEVLLSCHPYIPMKCEQVLELANFLLKRNPDLLKIITLAESDEDLTESFKTMCALKKEIKIPVIYHAAGSAGRLSRIINPLLGSHMIFCIDRLNGASIKEQIPLNVARGIIDNAELLK